MRTVVPEPEWSHWGGAWGSASSVSSRALLSLLLFYVYPEKQGAELGDSRNDLGDRQLLEQVGRCRGGGEVGFGSATKEKLAGCPH